MRWLSLFTVQLTWWGIGKEGGCKIIQSRPKISLPIRSVAPAFLDIDDDSSMDPDPANPEERFNWDIEQRFLLSSNPWQNLTQYERPEMEKRAIDYRYIPGFFWIVWTDADTAQENLCRISS